MSYDNGSRELSTTYTSDKNAQPLILAGAASYGSTDNLPLRDYVLVLHRYRLGIITCALLGAALVALMNYMSTANYTAQAVVNIGAYIPPLDGPMAATLRDETGKSEYVKNQITLLDSNTIANKVLTENPEILEYLGYGDYVKAPASIRNRRSQGNESLLAFVEESQVYDIPINALEDYLKLVSHIKIYETTMVRISALARTPEMAAKMANAQAQAFIGLVRQDRLRAANVNLKFLEKRAQKSADRTSTAERDLVNYALKHGIATSGIGLNRSVNLESLKHNLAEATLERATAEAQVREQRNRSGSFGSLEYTPALHSQYLELSKLHAEADQIRSFNRNHPAIKVLKDQAQTLQRTLRQYSDQQTKDAELKLKVASQKERILQGALREAEKSSLQDSQSAVEYNLLERQHQAARESHIAITQRLEDAIVNAENDQKTVILVDPALPPTAPSSLSDSFSPWHGMFLGTLLGIGLAILLNLLDNKIRTVGDIQHALTIPLLGVVPTFSKANMGLSVQNGNGKSESGGASSDTTVVGVHSGETGVHRSGTGSFSLADAETGFFPLQNGGTDSHMQHAGSQTMSVPLSASFVQSALNGNGETEIIDRSLVLLSAPFSSESEAFRTVLTTLTYSGAEAVPKALFITSGQPGDGKSTVAANLAVALAEVSGSTLLIDADLRLPSIHKHFNRPRLTPGLSDYLSGQREYNEIVHRGNVNNLSVIFAGNPVITPGMLLQSKKMHELLELLSDEFDHIILDGPPLNQVADALLLSRIADGVVLVVRSGKTPKPVAQSAVQHLHQIRANVLGTVLNGVNRSKANRQGDYYYIMEQYPRNNQQ